MEQPDPKTPTSPPQEEPEPKKIKMSTTTTDDDGDTAPTTETTTKQPRYKRRKIAIFFAYCGVGYQGMQKNPGAKTIEADLEEALFHAGAVPEQDRGNSKRYDWARSARTDKGVSAVGQVVSGRFYIDPPGFVERLDSNLPAQIKIFGYKRVTASFNAKKFCDRRRYVYLIPVFALDPSSHRDRGSVLASLGSGNELVKCLECSERGRKVVGVMGRRSFDSKISLDAYNGLENVTAFDSEIKAESGISSNSSDAKLDSGIEVEMRVSNENVAGDNLNSEFKEEPKVLVNNVESEVAVKVMASEENESSDLNSGSPNDTNVPAKEKNLNGEEKLVKQSEFFYDEKESERFNRILKHYVGSHNFHNFTTRTKAEDPSAQRYIISFDAKTIVSVEGIEFVKCEVVGQSFMLHQIRKMMGLAVAVMRNCSPESLIETALQKNVNINVPTAPEVGLYLDECFFTSYNKKWKDSHEELSMKAYEEEAEDFKMKHIYSHIASTEHKEGAVALWLHSLNHRNYPDLRVVNNGDTTDGKSVDDNGDTTNGKIVDDNKETSDRKSVDDNGDTTGRKTVDVENMSE